MTNNELFIKTLAVELKKERHRLGKTQQQVFSESRIHVGRVEMGLFTMNVTTLLKLCMYYRISLGELLNRIEEEIGPDFGLNPKSE